MKKFPILSKLKELGTALSSAEDDIESLEGDVTSLSDSISTINNRLPKGKYITFPAFEAGESKSVSVTGWTEGLPVSIQFMDQVGGAFFGCSNWWISNNTLNMNVKCTATASTSSRTIKMIYSL